MQRFDYALIIDCFQPLDLGQLTVLRQALAISRHAVVLVGSSEGPRTGRNPWSFGEQQDMICASLAEEAARVTVLPLRDDPYDETAWIARVNAQVAKSTSSVNDERIAIIANAKNASRRASAFPRWQLIDITPASTLPSSELRRCFYANERCADIVLKANVPEPVFAKICAFRMTDSYQKALDEFQHIETYRASWRNAPYPPIFVTADAVVSHSGHVLLVKRSGQPGLGLWALPGGFVNQNETLREAAIRELQEETRLAVPLADLLENVRGEKVFDYPRRSLRGRTITCAFHFELQHSGSLPLVRSGDDAARARWVPIEQLCSMFAQLFEDHFFILSHFLGTA